MNTLKNLGAGLLFAFVVLWNLAPVLFGIAALIMWAMHTPGAGFVGALGGVWLVAQYLTPGVLK